jgi:hypothetical protein
MKFFKIFLFSFAVLLTTVSPLYYVHADGLVPCTGDTQETTCTICDLVVGITGIVNWFMGIVFAACMLMLVVGGVMYIVSAGNPGMVTHAKAAITYALIGIIVIFTAFLLITFIMKSMSIKEDGGTDGVITGLKQAGTWTFDCSY